MKYRSKEIIIEATQLNNFNNLPNGVFTQYLADGSYQYYVITIHEQKIYVSRGDWIITEPDGIHHYPCKPDIFEKRYELIK